MTSANSNTRRIASLDGLRGLSIWAVLLTHASNHFVNTPLHEHYARMFFASFAYLGVTVFFVISGFLITLLLIKERVRTSTVTLRVFYRKRAVRILPAFLLYASVVLIVGRATLLQEAYAFTFTTSYFFSQAYRPMQQLWSLSVEEQFYLIWPLLIWRGMWTARRCCWTVMVVCPLLRSILKYIGYHEYSHLAPAILDSIAAGCLLAMHQDEVRSFARRYLLSTRSFLSLCFATVCVAEVLYRFDLVLLWGLSPCLIVVVISAAIEREDYLLNNGPLVWSGLLSYSLYLWQQPFLVFDGPLNYLSIRLVLTFATAYVSYRFVELPILKLFSPPPSTRQV